MLPTEGWPLSWRPAPHMLLAACQLGSTRRCTAVAAATASPPLWWLTVGPQPRALQGVWMQVACRVAVQLTK